MTLPRPGLTGRWSTGITMALLALAPFVLLSTAPLLFTGVLAQELGTDRAGLQLGQGLANASYAFSVVVAADLIRRVPPRRLYLGCTLLVAVGAGVSALAGSNGALVAGRVLLGLGSGMLLVVSLPPAVTGHGPRPIPVTVALINLGLFGGAVLGTSIGGFAASPGVWRWVFVAAAAIALAGFVVGLLGFERGEAEAPRMGFDPSGIPLAAVATFLPFVGVSVLVGHAPTSPGFLVPTVVGLAALVLLVVREHRKEDPLMPARLIAHTLPVTGIGAAMVTGAGFTAFTELAVLRSQQVEGHPPEVIGGALATETAGMLLAVWLIVRVLPTRWLPALVLGGLLTVCAGGGVLLTGGGLARTAVAGFLLGLGAGTGVGPGLFLGALSVPAPRLGPAFALVQLLRSEAAFLAAPVVLKLAMSGDPAAIERTILLGVVVTGGGAVVLTGILLLGGTGPQKPDLRRWTAGEGTAFHSRPVAAVLRERGGGTDV
ncbi:MFS transporter [Pseudonocardia sp. RS010]|uniref:MFS transporter n=1 Tax=Pseudonocardia sp. RS010 TaxID=3385979 RepID=UPI0039A3949D